MTTASSAGEQVAPPLAVTWVDLLDVAPDDVVLLVPGTGDAEQHLRRRTPHVHVVRDADAPHLPPRADLVCVDGVRLPPAQRRALRDRLVPGGRWAQVADNRLSPLRALDALRGRPGGDDARLRATPVGRRARGLDLRSVQVFALLRSTSSPVTACDLRSDTGTALTVEASLTHVGGRRGRALHALLRLPGRVMVVLLAMLTPGWLTVAHALPAPEPDPRRIVGKVANRDSVQVKLLRGDPPREIEKVYLDPAQGAAEAAALAEVGRSGFTLAAAVLADEGTRVRYSWLAGHPLEVAALDDEQLVDWTARAAAVLDDLQQRTRRDDGSVLVHGDFWLGNLLVDGDRLCGVLDWTDAHRGSPQTDREFLLATLLAVRPDDPALHRRLRAAVVRSAEEPR
ncbi:phosphotransferase [Nocardioides nanhaiensis]|uniref:Aminoglycoside phosphotransferase domain-containing protein n=1 Tax=Nocardioides nanhaiensis TaxID=1476871 RepID=A0ABP8VQJ7_9ACTN